MIRSFLQRAAVSGVASAVLLAGPAGAASAAKAPGGQQAVTINVAIAYPAPSKAALAAFTSSTGIHVNYSYVQWDDLQTKIAAAAEAHTYFADVTDVDWSKVGEYYQTKWFTPLNKFFNVASLPSQYPQVASFIRDGELVGMPSDASLLVTDVNTKDFAKAGITKMPTNFSQYQADLKTVQAKGIAAHPLDIPFAAAEGLSTYWYEMTAAFGGQVLSSSYKPEFTSPSSPGYKAMAWMVTAYQGGLVPKGNLSLDDYQAFSDDQAANLTASVFSDYSGDIGTIYDVPSSSKVVGQIAYIPTPGVNGPAPNLANPDGIGIPVTAKHVSAAVQFIKWYDSAANQAAFAGADGAAASVNGFPLSRQQRGLGPARVLRQGPGGGGAGGADVAALPGHIPSGSAPVVPGLQQCRLHQPARCRCRSGKRGQRHKRHRFAGCQPRGLKWHECGPSLVRGADGAVRGWRPAREGR